MTIDVQNMEPLIKQSLKRVGITGLKCPVIITRGGKVREIIVTLEVAVDLPSTMKGAHMSRFIESIEQSLDIPSEDAQGIEYLAEKIAIATLNKHDYASYAVVNISCQRSVLGKVYDLLASYDTASQTRTLGVTVEGATACPCSIEMTGGLSHNQKASLTLLVSLPSNIDVDSEELVGVCQKSFSSPTQALLKRPQEKEVVMRMHKNPKFVEDVVRTCYAELQKIQKIRKCRCMIRAESMESIHDHLAYAELEGVI